MRRLLAGIAMALLVTGCGAVARTPGSAPTPSPTASSTSGDASTSPSLDATTSPSSDATPAGSASPSPSTCTVNPLPGLCVGRPATAQEEAAMIAVGRPAAEQELGLKDVSACTGNDTCFRVGIPSRAMVGTDAGTFYGQAGGASGTGGGAGCWVFLYRDAAGWHYVNARCVQATGYIPGSQDRVWVSGCANVRQTPGMGGRVLACLLNGTIVDVDSAPVYTDGHIWWHLAGRGWMAHDFLVAPKSAP